MPSIQPPPQAGTSERRKHARFKPDGVVARFDKGGLLSKVGLGTLQARVVNMGEGGVLLLGKTRFAEGTRLTLRIDIPSHQDQIASDAEVRWCCEHARQAGDFYLGLSFSGLKAADVRKIGTLREWFASAGFKARSSARLRRLPDDGKA